MGHEEGYGLLCQEEGKESSQPAKEASGGLGWPLLSPFTARLFSLARKGHCVQSHGPGRSSGTPSSTFLADGADLVPNSFTGCPGPPAP